jgi:hypothetical protein
MNAVLMRQKRIRTAQNQIRTEASELGQLQRMKVILNLILWAIAAAILFVALKEGYQNWAIAALILWAIVIVARRRFSKGTIPDFKRDQ